MENPIAGTLNGEAGNTVRIQANNTDTSGYIAVVCQSGGTITTRP